MINPVMVNEAGKPRPHFVLVPFMAQGHMIPMVDFALLLARRGAEVSFITTPFNALRIRATIDRAVDANLPIKFVELPFPCKEMGLPEGCENLDAIPARELMRNYFYGLRLLAKPLELYLRQQSSRPTCIIADVCQPWTMEVARSFRIPRLSFFSVCCFFLLCVRNISHYKVYDTIADEHEAFAVPAMEREVVVTKAQAPLWFCVPGWEEFYNEVQDAENEADGVVVNTYNDLEPLYIESYCKAMGKKVWAVGPFSLYNEDPADLIARGGKASMDANKCMSWLDTKEPNSVVYVSFGSLAFVEPRQLMEVGLGLEASTHPFVWVIKDSEMSAEVEQWLSEGFEERVRSRGFLLKGWAQQVMILSHPAIGGFVTHCGWNSTLESVTAGVPMVTWPHFGDQFLNERMIVDVLRIGVSVGVTRPHARVNRKGEDDDGESLRANKEDLERAIRRVMDTGEEAEERRERVKELGKKAKEAMAKEGSSHANMMDLIQSFTSNGERGVEDK